MWIAKRVAWGRVREPRCYAHVQGRLLPFSGVKRNSMISFGIPRLPLTVFLKSPRVRTSRLEETTGGTVRGQKRQTDRLSGPFFDSLIALISVHVRRRVAGVCGIHLHRRIAELVSQLNGQHVQS